MRKFKSAFQSSSFVPFMSVNVSKMSSNSSATRAPQKFPQKRNNLEVAAAKKKEQQNAMVGFAVGVKINDPRRGNKYGFYDLRTGLTISGCDERSSL